MRLHRRVEGELGPVIDRNGSALPERWKIPLLVLTVVLCAAIFTAAFLIGLHHH